MISLDILENGAGMIFQAVEGEMVQGSIGGICSLCPAIQLDTLQKLYYYYHLCYKFYYYIRIVITRRSFILVCFTFYLSLFGIVLIRTSRELYIISTFFSLNNFTISTININVLH